MVKTIAKRLDDKDYIYCYPSTEIAGQWISGLSGDDHPERGKQVSAERKSLRDLVRDELREAKKDAPAFANVTMGSATYTKMLGKRY
ncbi:hypothetical protein AGRA3207_001225 [Actinomadura graeca]|uniref:Uncharacterized protein n=1 Tax=Actinomadura graeca TaxID=2750812 RepID=A0ABX8QQ07_9ACTN|nr:hypothetical protein [Actinomadura graeca]QXJ20501.1 hypothetical protein AGRA3207_001225 [Actinomadura graeca]